MMPSMSFNSSRSGAVSLRAADLLELKLIDGIIPEPPGGAQEDPDAAAESLRQHLRRSLNELDGLSPDQLVQHRYAKFRQMGNFFA